MNSQPQSEKVAQKQLTCRCRAADCMWQSSSQTHLQCHVTWTHTSRQHKHTTSEDNCTIWL